MPAAVEENGRLKRWFSNKRLYAAGLFTFVVVIIHQFAYNRAPIFSTSSERPAPSTETSISATSTHATLSTASVTAAPNITAQLQARLDIAANNTKVILLWGYRSPFGRNSSDRRLGWQCGSCIVTRNTKRIMEPNIFAVAFNYRSVKPGKMPSARWRRPEQLYVWQTGESPTALIKGRYMDFKFEDTIKFNATLMVRRDSDIFETYGDALSALRKARRRLDGEYRGDLRKILEGKTDFAVALTSNCFYAAAGLRIAALYRLKAFGLKLDGFGKCFHRLMPKSGNKLAELNFLRKYKFYLAFENSYHCRDYITEKFFINALALGVLPVVWGPRREDYEAIAPPNSFIHFEDFPSEKELVNYLKYLDKNDTAYLEYFKWYLLKDEDMPTFGRSTGMCQLCRVLHGINLDDRFNSKYNKTNPIRPLFTDGVAPRTLPPMRRLIADSESEDCFKIPGSSITPQGRR